MKIKEMNDTDWIPCCKRLPESNEPEVICLVTYQDYNVFEDKWECRKVGVMSYLTKHQIRSIELMIRYWVVRNVLAKTFLRNNEGEIRIFIDRYSAGNYISTLPKLDLWEVVEFRR